MFPEANLDSLSEEQLDALPYGAIQLSPEGTIMRFNFYETQKTNLMKGDVIGKNFFKEIAPCTDVQQFYGRFLEGVKRKNLHEDFEYYFAFKQAPREVMITMFYSDMTDSVWVVIRQLKVD